MTTQTSAADRLREWFRTFNNPQHQRGLDVALDVALAEARRDEREKVVAKIQALRPTHFEGQGEVCDQFCPVWHWNSILAAISADTTGAEGGNCPDHRIEGVSPFCPNCGVTA